MDHIDVVSVASCTPQSRDCYNDGALKREWHDAFRESVRRIGQEDEVRRHHAAVLVLANYREMDAEETWGLSGVFIPHTLELPSRLLSVQLSAFARCKPANVFTDRWFAPREIQELGNREAYFESRGFIAALVPREAAASLLRFNLTRLGSDARGWGSKTSLTSLSVRDVMVGGSGGGYTFVERGT